MSYNRPVGCDSCDHMGPEASGLQDDLINLHRALHQLWRAVTVPFVPLFVYVVARLSADVQRGTQPPTPEDQ